MSQTYRGDERITGREIGRAGQQAGMSPNMLLDDDHNRVLQLFDQYDNHRSTASPADKNRVAREILRELKIHTVLEEEIYYPRMREKADIDDRIAAMENDHEAISQLIKDVESASSQDDELDERMIALGKAVRDHISEERDGLFDVAEVMGINTPEIARRLHDRKQELLQEMPH